MRRFVAVLFAITLMACGKDSKPIAGISGSSSAPKETITLVAHH
jgi:hypothetical protein